MADFVGSKCMICQERFQPEDDVVVCPDCGTPYHRECWQKEGRCVNEKLHSTGEGWKQDSLPELRCPRCGARNLSDASFCSNCGMPFGAEVQMPERSPFAEGEAPRGEGMGPFQVYALNFGDPLCGLNPEETFEEVPVTEVADYVGSNTFYFLPLFKAFKETGRKISWNLSAILLTPYYFAFRKMYGLTIISILMELLLELPQVIWMLSDSAVAGTFFYEFVSQFDVKSVEFQTLLQFTSWFGLMFHLFLGLFFNWMYYRHVLNRVKKLKAKVLDSEASAETGSKKLHETLKAKGGVSMPLAMFLFGIAMLLSFYIVMLFY